jgi:cob(I)alamin adenosyltransferase
MKPLLRRLERLELAVGEEATYVTEDDIEIFEERLARYHAEIARVKKMEIEKDVP